LFFHLRFGRTPSFLECRKERVAAFSRPVMYGAIALHRMVFYWFCLAVKRDSSVTSVIAGIGAGSSAMLFSSSFL